MEYACTLIVLVAAVVYGDNQQVSKIYTRTAGMRLLDRVMLSVHVSGGHLECSEACQLHDECMSYNVITDGECFICEINSNEQKDSLVSDVNSFYYGKYDSYLIVACSL